MFERLGYVNAWTEFLIAPIGALYHLVEDFGDLDFLSTIWASAQGNNITDGAALERAALGAVPFTEQTFPFFSLAVRRSHVCIHFSLFLPVGSIGGSEGCRFADERHVRCARE